MLRRRNIMSVLVVLTLLCSVVFSATFETGKTYHGFKLNEKRFVKEVNAECLFFEHLKSGAHLLKIDADDANKTFSIFFRTVAVSNSGNPHIMEHSVLNGSKNFPVKSPFDVLSKGSLKTFLNALTGSDVTMYPVASMNNKDYFNLMHVYLDAVFNPLIYSDPRIFKQEGWHMELTHRDSAIVYKGVVYNEMKGAFSSPERELYYQCGKHLFPENNYRYSSGGYPRDIPDLTYEEFLDYHRRLYHPSNSGIMLYGDADLDKELSFIDEKYLANYDRAKVKVEVPVQKPFKKMKTVTEYYPVPEDGDTHDQTFLCLNIVAGMVTDRALYMSLDALTDILVNNEAGPIRVALQEAGIGKEVRARVDDGMQNVFTINVQNANPEDSHRFREIVYKTLEEVVEKGLDKEIVQGVINRMEFGLREGNSAQKGLKYNFELLAGWLFAGDPFLSLEYEKPLEKLKTALTSTYLESVISDYIIDNPHALLMTLEPKPGLDKINNAEIRERLAQYKESLSNDEIDALVEETKELIAYQKREDSEEALATIPLLDLDDINPKAEWYEVETRKISGTKMLQFETFTNDVVYVKLYFDTRVLPMELIPYAGLLSNMLGSLNTENYSYGDLDNAMNIHTGGFQTYLSTYLENRDNQNLIPKFVISSKAMNYKVEKLFELLAEIVNESKYSDSERLKAVLTRHASQKESRVKNRGLYYALTRLTSYYTKEGMFDEMTNGLDYYWFLHDLSGNFDEKSSEIISELDKTTKLLFNRSNMIAAVSCQSADISKFRKSLKGFIKTLPKSSTSLHDWEFNLEKKNEGIYTASKVQYVVQGYDLKKLGYDWNGKMLVLDQILSSDWLHNQVRVIGGAYGGFSGFSADGQVFFGSYRDPNLSETLDNYSKTPDYLHNFSASESEMTRYIIGTISRKDSPLTPSQKGNRAVRRYFENVTEVEEQNERNAVLKTTADDIKAMEKMIDDMLKQNAYCVYGNEEKVKSEEGNFKKVIPLVQ